MNEADARGVEGDLSTQKNIERENEKMIHNV